MTRVTTMRAKGVLLAGIGGLALVLAGCSGDTQQGDPDAADKAGTTTAATPAATASADPFASNDTVNTLAMDDQPRPEMQLQVVLDRLGFSPGVIDGKVGLSTKNALTAFQTAKGLTVTGEADEATKAALAEQLGSIAATRVVTIPEGFAELDYVEIPEGPEAKANLEAMGYESAAERLAERFHTKAEVLLALNPELAGGAAPAAEGSDPAAPATDGTTEPAPATAKDSAKDGKANTGDAKAAPAGDAMARLNAALRGGVKVRVPNIGGDGIVAENVADAGWRTTLASLGIGSEQPDAARLVVSKSKGTMIVYDAADKIIGAYTVTTGSKRDPLPLGDWKITATAFNPTYNYNPERFWYAKDDGPKVTLPAGPNSPVGVVWIDLSKENYGIHGTPDPETIGRAESAGCVRLTNWDAARVAQMVSKDTQVEFVA